MKPESPVTHIILCMTCLKKQQISKQAEAQVRQRFVGTEQLLSLLPPSVLTPECRRQESPTGSLRCAWASVTALLGLTHEPFYLVAVNLLVRLCLKTGVYSGCG